MNRINKYLLSHFLSTFASLFSTLFLIMSIVFFIQIARVTAYIEISFFELVKLYTFTLPRVLLFVVPIAFFVSLAMMLFRLSKENETIVIFTLGHSPTIISRFFLKFSAFLSVTLLIIALVFIPKASELNANFIDYKKTIAKLNLKGGQFGQKFSDWMVYISEESDDKTTYKDIVMYNPKNSEQKQLLIAKQATINNENGVIELKLDNGKAYNIGKQTFHVSEFKTLKIRTKQNESVGLVSGIKEYWLEAKTSQKRKKDLSTYILIALFPLASTLFAISFGIVTYRYDKGIVYVGTFAVLFGYFSLIMILGAKPIVAIPAIFAIFLISSFFYYKAKIIKKY
ncbi:membrane protein [Campylobacter mucosalis]|uniref:Putative lipooligosaccharide transport system, permease component (LptF family) n=1 Tax=Campylobacter mucosalis CCUG 21559 TaxID=1032067 RepID=A0A6G5QHF4_9BACT|nr:LptF/LptG family permease [Campylobacter mucosalis]KEA46595.1 membrane protein [Campylobacter mucosalis]QCD45007.1 putative lipooligosaccharide transport system, permease component (LptF family) [Campylobacter mucosalis CCUG 21559]QKF62896.1 lipooligosaccharide transport system, ABC transporter permease component LptF [Campylobacter mucosalis]